MVDDSLERDERGIYDNPASFRHEPSWEGQNAKSFQRSYIRGSPEKAQKMKDSMVKKQIED